MKNKKIYSKNWFMWLMLILFAPLGIFLLYRYKRFSPKIRGLVSLIFSIFFLVALSNATENRNNTASINSVTSQKSVTNPNIPTISTEAKSTKPLQNPKTKNESKTASESLINSGILKVHYIDIGQADCILIQSPNNKVMLIDAGNNSDKEIITSYIKSQGISKIDVVLGTHPHEDHIGSMDSVISTFNIGSIYLPKKSTTTKTFESLLNAINNKGLKVTTAFAGVNIPLDDAVKTELFAPNNSNYEDLNNYSAVVKLTYNNTSFLFEGDAEELSENEMISKGYDVKAEVLKVGHHGSNSSTSSKFLKQVSPQYAIISVGKNNDYNHPSLETLKKLSSSNIKVYRTDEVGTIIVSSDGNTITVDKKVSPIKPQAPPQVTTKAETQSLVNNVNISSEDKKEVIVYITNAGKKYHLGNCRYLNKSKVQISLTDAKSRGYEPCNVCQPEQ